MNEFPKDRSENSRTKNTKEIKNKNIFFSLMIRFVWLLRSGVPNVNSNRYEKEPNGPGEVKKKKLEETLNKREKIMS